MRRVPSAPTPRPSPPATTSSSPGRRRSTRPPERSSTADVAGQAQRCFDNLEAVLAAAGLTFDDVVKVNVYLTSMDDFGG